jgi:spore germination protein GerM
VRRPRPRPRPRPRALAGAVLLLAVLLLAAGCGVVADDGPRAIPRAQVPFHLLTRTPPSTTTTTALADVPVTVYFVAPDQQALVTAARTVPTDNTLRTVLHTLFAGPTTVEKTRGVRTAIGSGVRLLKVRPERPGAGTAVVTLDFNQAFGQISGTQQVLAVAQLVFTTTAYLGTGFGVQFEIDGVATDVPTATGAQVAGPVHRTRYASLAPAGP